MKIGKESTEEFLKQLSFTNSNMTITESTGGAISILLGIGGSMRRYLYSNLLKIIFGSLLIITFIFSVIYFICSLLIDKSTNIASLILIILCLLLWLFLELMIFILNKKANNSILFEEGKVIYKKQTIYSYNLSMKYFKFYISIIEPSLVIPKIHINGNNLSVTCYLSKKDIKNLKK